jgi:hypothetical protein
MIILIHPQFGEISVAIARQEKRKWYVHPVDEKGRVGVRVFGPFSTKKKAINYIQTNGAKSV